METLYHYCSVEAMFSILKSRTIWLSNSLNMNDHMENRLGSQILWEELQVYEAFSRREAIEKARNLYEIIDLVPYVFCLSTANDSLSQWRAYSADGAGVALGFNPGKLGSNRDLPILSAHPNASTTLCQVEYSAERHRTITREYLTQHLGAPETGNKRLDYKTINKVTQGFRGNSVLFKNHAFEEEREWRLIHSPLMSMKRESPGAHLASDLLFNQRVSNGLIQTYFEFPLADGFLNEIVLGPKCQIQDFDLKRFLWANRYDYKTIKLRSSKATYR